MGSKADDTLRDDVGGSEATGWGIINLLLPNDAVLVNTLVIALSCVNPSGYMLHDYWRNRVAASLQMRYILGIGQLLPLATMIWVILILSVEIGERNRSIPRDGLAVTTATAGDPEWGTRHRWVGQK